MTTPKTPQELREKAYSLLRQADNLEELQTLLKDREKKGLSWTPQEP